MQKKIKEIFNTQVLIQQLINKKLVEGGWEIALKEWKKTFKPLLEEQKRKLTSEGKDDSVEEKAINDFIQVNEKHLETNFEEEQAIFVKNRSISKKCFLMFTGFISFTLLVYLLLKLKLKTLVKKS